MPQITRIHFKIFLLPNPLTNVFPLYKKLAKISLLAQKTPNAKKSLLEYSFKIRVLFYYYSPLHSNMAYWDNTASVFKTKVIVEV